MSYLPKQELRKDDKVVYFHELVNDMKVLVATEKPFAKTAVDGIRNIVEGGGYKLALLEKYTDVADLYKAVEDADALIVRSDKVTAEVVAAAKNLKIVVRAGAGYDNVDLAACTARGIVVMNTPGQNSNAVAELALGMMIFMARNKFSPGTGTEIMGKTLGIHAYGNVGRLVALKGKALGMNVIAFSRSLNAADLARDGVEKVGSVEELYAKSQYLSLHIPANDQTKKSIGYELLKSMPKGATLVNTARKEVIDEEGLVKVLAEREDLKYATDIAAGNQAELDEKFGARVFATAKKMGAETAEANVNAGLAAANQIVDFFKTGNTKFQVNK
jgi:D-3-phosphoglycerate dehydrogenase